MHRHLPPNQDALHDALAHSAALVREKIGELSLIRELAECVSCMGDSAAMATRITHAIRNHLEAEGVALFGRSGGGEWIFLGGASVAAEAHDPAVADLGLLDQADQSAFGIAVGGILLTSGMTSQQAIALRQGPETVGILVVTDTLAKEFPRQYRELFGIVARQVANLLGAAWMYQRITDANRYLEETLEIKARELREAQERVFQQEKLAALGQLVMGVSHELNNRLVPILGYAQLLAAMPDLSEQTTKASHSIEVAALGCKEILDNMLSFARPQQPKREPVNICEMIGEVVRGIEASDQWHTPVQIASASPPPVLVDPRQMERVFHNLIKNALQATENCPNGAVRISFDTTGNWVMATVEDTGTGMPQEVRRRIFEPFFTTKGIGHGTGLGLSLSYGLVRAHGGDITVISREGEGSRFVVSLPVCVSGGSGSEPSQAPGNNKATNDVNGSNGLKKNKILVVDDEGSVRQLVVEILSPEYQVATVTDGDEAEEMLRAEQFDIVLLDLRMPRKNGMRLFDWVKSTQPELAPRVVFMTGNLRDPGAREFLEAQPNPRLIKPFTIQELAETVRQAAN